VTRETVVTSLAAASDAAAAIGYPVVLKVVSDDIPHKSEHGLVAVGCRRAGARRRLRSDAAHIEKLGRRIAGYLGARR